MGLYHSVILFCPECKEGHEFQSKKLEGLDRHEPSSVPIEIAQDLIAGMSITCKCGRILCVREARPPSNYMSLHLEEV